MFLANVFYTCFGGEVKIIFLSDIAHKIVIKMVLEVIILQLSVVILP